MKTFTIRESAHKGIGHKYSAEGTNDVVGIPLGQGVLKDFKDSGCTEGTLQWLDVVPDSTGCRIIKEQNIRDRKALVLVETAPGVGGALKLFANTVGEVMNDKRQRVERVANPFPPPGVELIASRVTETLAPEYLVAMWPGASFRITRSGKLHGGAPEIVVLWNGRWDQRAEYDDFRRPSEALVQKVKADKKSCTPYEIDSVRYLTDPMHFWGLSVYFRTTRHGEV